MTYHPSTREVESDKQPPPMNIIERGSFLSKI